MHSGGFFDPRRVNLETGKLADLSSPRGKIDKIGKGSAQKRGKGSTRTYKPLPPADRLRELLNYDPEPGSLTWKVKRTGRAAKAGSIAGHLCTLRRSQGFN